MIEVRETMAYTFKIGYVLAAVRRGFTSTILGVIPKKHVQWPKLCVSEIGQHRRIRPEHQGNNNPVQITIWFSGRFL
jgi:hypothetical protein